LGVLGALALLGAVLASGRGSERPADFAFINRGDVSTLDIATISWMQDLRVARLVYEGLTRNDVFTDNFESLPGVAERWDVSPDGREYTFHLRENARWSNGAPVVAGDFVFSWRRAMLPDAAGDYVKMFTLIEGGGEFVRWRTNALERFAKEQAGRTQDERRAAAESLWEETKRRFAETVAIRAIHERTLRVTLVRPTPYFLGLTAFPPLFPTYPALVESHTTIDPASGMLKTRPEWTKAGRLVGNGPFVMTRWRFKRDMRFEQNPHYWDRGRLAVESIAIPSVQDGNAQVIAFRTGAVQWVSDVTPQYRGDMLREKHEFYAERAGEVARLHAEGLDAVEVARRLPPDPRNHIHTFPAFGTYFFNFNCKETLGDGRANPLRDARARRALSMAVDRRGIVEYVRRIGEEPASTLIPRGSIAGYASPVGVSFDPDGARALLAEVGGAEALGEIEIMFNKEGGHDLVSQSIAKDWQRELGVRVRLAQKEIKVFREDLKNGNFMVSRAGWFGDYGDPTTFLNINNSWLEEDASGQIVLRYDGNNDRKYANARYSELLRLAAAEADPKRRMELLAEAERIVVEQDPALIPIYRYVQIYLFDPHRITGISGHPRQEQHMDLVDVFGDGLGTDVPRVMRRGREDAGSFMLRGTAPAPTEP
jgi:oligopeptide transport system substrate-binding protein